MLDERNAAGTTVSDHIRTVQDLHQVLSTREGGIEVRIAVALMLDPSVRGERDLAVACGLDMEKVCDVAPFTLRECSALGLVRRMSRVSWDLGGGPLIIMPRWWSHSGRWHRQFRRAGRGRCAGRAGAGGR